MRDISSRTIVPWCRGLHLILRLKCNSRVLTERDCYAIDKKRDWNEKIISVEHAVVRNWAREQPTTKNPGIWRLCPRILVYTHFKKYNKSLSICTSTKGEVVASPTRCDVCHPCAVVRCPRWWHYPISKRCVLYASPRVMIQYVCKGAGPLTCTWLYLSIPPTYSKRCLLYCYTRVTILRTCSRLEASTGWRCE